MCSRCLILYNRPGVLFCTLVIDGRAGVTSHLQDSTSPYLRQGTAFDIPQRLLAQKAWSSAL
jgi:hypothetical protein